MLVIVACPRSGTRFISTLFKEHGLDVGHEAWGVDGTAWWQLAGDDSFWRGFNFCPREPATAHPAVHQVREPLACIASMFTIADVSWEIMRVRMSDSVLRRGMYAYVHWNRLAQRRASYTYRVENYRAEFSELCRRGRFTAVLHNPVKTSEKTNSREHPSLTWAELEKEDAALAREVKAVAAGYGYAV